MNKTTEKHNVNTSNIDNLDISEILEVINNEDSTVPGVINKILPDISAFVEKALINVMNGGRIFYIGCGTSGRLGVLDAAECPPTFSVEPTLFNGIIAGGHKALVKSVENAEDIENDGFDIINEKNINKYDVVLGISASSTAPFVIGALKNSFNKGAITALLCCNKIDKPNYVEHLISAVTGPEVITGSTRMKAGTATKLILNMISTTLMIKLNKVYGNYMVDLKISNNKLKDRGIRIISEIAKVEYSKAKTLLENSDNNVKIAIVMHKNQLSIEDANSLLNECNGNLRLAIKDNND